MTDVTRICVIPQIKYFFFEIFARKWAGFLRHHFLSCFPGVCWWEMSPPPFLPTYISTVNKRQREREGKKNDHFFPSLCTSGCPDFPSSVLTPTSPQLPVNKAYMVCFASIALSTHLLCPSVHFTELELPAATLEKKKRWEWGLEHAWL